MLLSKELFSNYEKAAKMPSTVYHYCSTTAFLSILENDSLRLSNVTKSNDPTEITNIIPVLKEVTKDVLTDYNRQISAQYRFADNTISMLIDRFFEDISKNFYVFCFSEKRDLLSQWDRYADNAKGIAIGFNTRHFVRLQVETGSQYIFGKIIYDQNILVKSVERFLRYQIDKNWEPNDDCHNINLIENATTNLVCTVLQFSVLFKDSFFCEESEWRLVYNPLGRIRRLGYAAAYHDRLIETNQYQHERSGFSWGGYRFLVKGSNLSSYVDLNFRAVRDALIQEIVIGPKSSLKPDDKDLQLFLALHGYKISKLTIEGSLILTKSDRPFQ